MVSNMFLAGKQLHGFANHMNLQFAIWSTHHQQNIAVNTPQFPRPNSEGQRREKNKLTEGGKMAL